jgi:hypothetical protein
MRLKPPSQQRIIPRVRRYLLRWIIVFLVAVLLCGHVTELFDEWDHTLTTGRDVDYSLVVVAACAGAIFVVARYLALSLGDFRLYPLSLVPQLLIFSYAIYLETNGTGLSPPPSLALRI